MSRFVTRNFGTSLSFDGINGQVTLSNPGINIREFSFSFWANTGNQDGDDNGWHDLFNLVGASGGSLVSEVTGTAGGDGSLQLYILAGFAGATQIPMSSVNICNKGYKHFVVSASATGNVVNSYMNGALVGTSTWAPASEVINTLCIGNRNGNSTRFATVIMDDVFIFNAGLTQTEVTKLYYEGIIPASIAVEYLFNEGSGTSATDSSVNNFTGTITNATYSSAVAYIPRTLAGTRTLHP